MTVLCRSDEQSSYCPESELRRFERIQINQPINGIVESSDAQRLDQRAERLTVGGMRLGRERRYAIDAERNEVLATTCSHEFMTVTGLIRGRNGEPLFRLMGK